MQNLHTLVLQFLNNLSPESAFDNKSIIIFSDYHTKKLLSIIRINFSKFKFQVICNNFYITKLTSQSFYLTNI